jgi:hypothetical protein
LLDSDDSSAVEPQGIRARSAIGKTAMAEKKAKTAEKGGTSVKHSCPQCGAESRVVYYTGFGKRGYFWSCEKGCGYVERTR